MVIPHLGDWKKTLITFVFGTFVRKIIGKQKIIGKLFCYAYNDIAVTHGSSNISFIIECATHQIGYLTMQYKCSHDSVKHLKMELLWKYYWLKHWSFLLQSSILHVGQFSESDFVLVLLSEQFFKWHSTRMNRINDCICRSIQTAAFRIYK